MQLNKKHPVIWEIDLVIEEEILTNYEQLLSSDETLKADRFHFDKDRVAFIAARGALRTLLGRYTGIATRELKIEYEKHGKPVLSKELNGLQFNVSHSFQKGLIGFNVDVPIGVDIEWIKFTEDLVDVAKRFFSKSEVKSFLSLSMEKRPEGFFNCWTRKEAFIKAVGHGLSFPLDQFEVSLKPNEKTELMATHFEPQEKEFWSLENLAVPEGYKGAFAIKESIDGYTFNKFDHVVN